MSQATTPSFGESQERDRSGVLPKLEDMPAECRLREQILEGNEEPLDTCAQIVRIVEAGQRLELNRKVDDAEKSAGNQRPVSQPYQRDIDAIMRRVRSIQSGQAGER